MPFESGLQHVGEGVAGNADEASHLLFLRLHGGRIGAVFGRHCFEILRPHQGVHVQEVHMVNLEALQADLEPAHEIVIFADLDLVREPQAIAAARFEHLAHSNVALTVLAVGIRGVDIGDAHIERLVQDLGAFVRAVADKPAAAAECQDGHLGAGAPERPHRHTGGRNQRRRHRSQRRRA